MRRALLFCLLLLPGLAPCFAPGHAQARTGRPAPAEAPPPPPPLTPPAMCESAIAAAESAQKLPSRVLASIALRESGRADPDTGRVRPWPWSINFEGVGHVYATKEDAIAAVQAIQMTGGLSIDVGCMQVNLMHHPGAFASLDEAFDPKANSAYAARFLKSLFGSMGDWGTAIAAYHSRTPGVGEPYRDMVVATWGPTDPAVLAKLTMTPLPGYLADLLTPLSLGVGPGPLAGATARAIPIPIGPSMAYRAFAATGAVSPSPAYRSFQPIGVAYADFSSKPGKKPGGPMAKAALGRPLDLRLDGGFASAGKVLVVPKAIIDRTAAGTDKPMARRHGESG